MDAMDALRMRGHPQNVHIRPQKASEIPSGCYIKQKCHKAEVAMFIAAESSCTNNSSVLKARLFGTLRILGTTQGPRVTPPGPSPRVLLALTPFKERPTPRLEGW